MSDRPPPFNLSYLPDWPALMSLDVAAAYCGMSPDSFEACVERNRFPGPVPLPIRRKLWARQSLDKAISSESDGLDAERRERAWHRKQDDRLAEIERRSRSKGGTRIR